MNAKEFRLKNGKHEPRFTTEKRYIVYEENEVERLMEEYHQAKVNNVVLDDVSVSDCISDNEANHYMNIDCIGYCDRCGSTKKYER